MLTPKDVHAMLAAADGDAGLFVPRAALATLVRTEGSSFRRAGSQMLVGANGRIVRGFSGGCPESDIALRATRVIASGIGERARYNRENGLDLLIEMGCGGELEIVLEPMAERASLRFLDVIAERWRSRETAIMASGFPADPSRTAAGRLIWCDGKILLDGLGNDTAAAVIAAADSGHSMTSRTLVLAGAATDVLYQPILPPIQLVLIGANAVADTLARAARDLAWPVVRIDPRTTTADEFARRSAIGGSGEPPVCDGNTFVVCMTYQLERDLDYAAAALATAVPYVGILGSHRRAAQMQQRLDERCGGAARGRLFTPAGLSIGSEDVEEIAVSLVAEIMAVAARKSGLPLSRSSEPIHANNVTGIHADSRP
ncbi:MAG: XdhC family protein [Rudaea sp.]|nr:XdhC family protein [Rudaea sp.]